MYACYKHKMHSKTFSFNLIHLNTLLTAYEFKHLTSFNIKTESNIHHISTQSLMAKPLIQHT